MENSGERMKRRVGGECYVGFGQRINLLGGTGWIQIAGLSPGI